MKRTKIASAVLLAAVAGFASAQEIPASKEVVFDSAADLVIQAEGNAIFLTQTAVEGAELGNDSQLFQSGDLNFMQVDVFGEANEVLGFQNGFSNTFVGYIDGSFNAVLVDQQSDESIADISIFGNNNSLSLVQLGDGGPFGFIFNRSINSIVGDDNSVDIFQNDGGNWANNTVFGSGNSIDITQNDEWHESYVRDLFGSDNEIEVSQSGFYNISNVVSVVGDANELEIDQDGDSNRLTIAMDGSGNSVDIEQDGNSNSFEFGVFTAADDNIVNVDQTGDSNVAQVDTINGFVNDFEINQIGFGNDAYQGVIGVFNSFYTLQVGDLNEASAVNFDGFVNEVTIQQIGDENLALAQAGIGGNGTADANVIFISQDGSANDASVELASTTTSNGNAAEVIQNGEFNLVDLLLNGNDNIASVYQEGVGNWVTDETGSQFMITGDLNTFSVTQIGNDNLVSGTMTGNGGTISVTQVGDFNTATVVQL